MSDTTKIMGIVPKEKYVHFAYMFLLVSAAGNALFSLFSLIGLNFESAVYGCMVLGLLALILAVVGLTSAKNEFTANDHAHFKYIGALFVAFFIINIVFGGVYALSYALGYICTIILGGIQTVMTWTGYSSWQDGQIVTKDNFKEQLKVAIAKR